MAVDRDADLGGLGRLAEQRDLVDGERLSRTAVRGLRHHLERPDGVGDRGVDALAEPVLAIFVHQEADGALVHSVDAPSRTHIGMHGLQHEAVAAKRDDDFGILDPRLAVKGRQALARLTRIGRVGGDKGESAGTKVGLRRMLHAGASSSTNSG